jgi:prepilin-type processing-associated H-X9-DG protein/prepilin-type N-terminal cleavage/methylation domain-containing protein
MSATGHRGELRSNPSRETGFTLLELLVVIVMVVLLAALLVPAISKAQNQAHSTACGNHLRQMGQALQMYVHENRSNYPYLRTLPDGNDYSYGLENNRWWWARLWPYYPVKWTNTTYHCPGYKGALTGEGDHHGPLGSYAYNARGVRPPFAGVLDQSHGVDVHFPNVSFGLGPTLYVSFPNLRPQPISESQIKAPSEMLAIGESRFLNTKANGIPGGHCDMMCGGVSRQPNPPGRDEFAFAQSRHGKNYNQAFCDGHVAAMSPEVLFNPTNSAPNWNYDHEPHQELWMP